jgi:hypothetical protein
MNYSLGTLLFFIFTRYTFKKVVNGNTFRVFFKYTIFALRFIPHKYHEACQCHMGYHPMRHHRVGIVEVNPGLGRPFSGQQE